ncbi:glutamate receptor 3 isoform X2 [Cephus cinctus]|nr:glutamate receptor 3 isoform X2 [Cephus cinctus]XP_015586939.1 glutamate receptor 3 isoform X2 [Cephus cinctus]
MFKLINKFNNLEISAAMPLLTMDFNVEKLKTSYWKIGIILDLRCQNKNFAGFMSETAGHYTYTNLYNWLILGESLDSVLPRLNDSTYSVVTDLVIATPILDGYVLHDVYNPSKYHGGSLNVTELGDWHRSSGLNITLTHSKFNRRANYHGMILRVLTVTQFKPNNTRLEDYLEDYSNKSIDLMSKFVYPLMQHLCDIFNFTMDLSTDFYWDEIAENGSHTGMMGMLNRGFADITGSPGAINQKRFPLGELVMPIWNFRTCFFFLSSPLRSTNELLQPFSTGSWYATGALTILIALILSISLAFEKIDHWIRQYGIALFSTICILCQQGSSVIPNFLTGRLVFLQLLFFSLLIFNYYSACIVSVRLNQPLDKINDSLNELAESNMDIAAERIVYYDYLLETSTDWEVQMLKEKRWSKMSDAKKYLPLEEGLKRITRGGFAYHCDPNRGYPLMEKLFTSEMICRLSEVHLYHPQGLGAWVGHHSPFREIARVGLAKINDMGLRKRQAIRWSARKPICVNVQQTVNSVTFTEIKAAIFLLLLGVMLSLIICLLENIIYNWNTKKRYERDN